MWKTAFQKAQLETRPRNKAEVQELVDCVTCVKNSVNSMARMDGYAPHEGKSLLERRMELRCAVRKAFLEAEGDIKFRKALEHRTTGTGTF